MAGALLLGLGEVSESMEFVDGILGKEAPSRTLSLQYMKKITKIMNF